MTNKHSLETIALILVAEKTLSFHNSWLAGLSLIIAYTCTIFLWVKEEKNTEEKK